MRTKGTYALGTVLAWHWLGIELDVIFHYNTVTVR
jgi:hypothetical protein